MFIFLCLFGLIAIYIWYHRNFSYWSQYPVKFIKPWPIVGNCWEICTLKTGLHGQLQKFYERPEFKEESAIGVFIFHRPALLIKDLELIKLLQIKKFECFVKRAIDPDPQHDPIGYNCLLLCPTEMWRQLRARLSPMFTSAKTKEMFPLMLEVNCKLNKIKFLSTMITIWECFLII